MCYAIASVFKSNVGFIALADVFRPFAAYMARAENEKRWHHDSITAAGRNVLNTYCVLIEAAQLSLPRYGWVIFALGKVCENGRNVCASWAATSIFSCGLLSWIFAY